MKPWARFVAALILSLVVTAFVVRVVNFLRPEFTDATEQEVKSSIKIGMDQKAVLERFGHPLSIQVGQGFELWIYPTGPVVRPSDSNYGGFEVVFTNKKVTSVEIILSGR
jgi:hypothetical protein